MVNVHAHNLLFCATFKNVTQFLDYKISQTCNIQSFNKAFASFSIFTFLAGCCSWSGRSGCSCRSRVFISRCNRMKTFKGFQNWSFCTSPECGSATACEVIDMGGVGPSPAPQVFNRFKNASVSRHISYPVRRSHFAFLHECFEIFKKHDQLVPSASAHLYYYNFLCRRAFRLAGWFGVKAKYDMPAEEAILSIHLMVIIKPIFDRI